MCARTIIRDVLTYSHSMCASLIFFFVDFTFPQSLVILPLIVFQRFRLADIFVVSIVSHQLTMQENELHFFLLTDVLRIAAVLQFNIFRPVLFVSMAQLL